MEVHIWLCIPLWEELGVRARATNWLHLGEYVFFTIMDKTIAFKLWDSPCSAWDGKSASNKVLLMKKLLRLSMKEASSVSSHLNEFNALYLQELTLKDLNFDYKMKAIFLLCSSPASWDTFNTVISNSTHGGKLAFGDVTSVLLTEEIKRQSLDSGGHAYRQFKEGGKNIPFLTYDGTFGAIDKVLAFIQQFDAAFGDEDFIESSKLRHIAIHFQNSARQWWANLQANGEAQRTWKALRASIMDQLFASDAKDKVLTKWRSIKLTPYESIHKYVDKFWDLHLKATVYKTIDSEEQKQQFCAGLPKDMSGYVSSQRPKSISTIIHHNMVATRINFQQGTERNLKPMETKDKQEYKGKNFSQNSSKGNSSKNNNKDEEKGVFKGNNKLSPKELESYCKEKSALNVESKGTPIILAPKEMHAMSHLELPKLKPHKRMLIAKNFYFPMLGKICT
ncbi:hypothetical protein L7F22_035118 [Adiantum nelumboides]|nr:hypothetical protein [Adiantum nelumboides]